MYVLGVVLLYKVRQCSDGIRNNKAAAKLTTTILRLGEEMMC